MRFFSDNRPKKIFILLGHPDPSPETLTGQLCLLYETAARKAGHEVRRMNLYDMKFDPVLHHGYRVIQDLEPDLLKVQECIKWADHMAIFYPIWWAAMPAQLKGMFDRMWLPAFAYNMRKTKQGTPALGWRKRLKGKTARIVTLSGTHPFFIWCLFGDFTNDLTKSILWFAGIKVKTTRFGPSEIAPEWKKNEWRRKVTRLGRLGE